MSETEKIPGAEEAQRLLANSLLLSNFPQNIIAGRNRSLNFAEEDYGLMSPNLATEVKRKGEQSVEAMAKARQFITVEETAEYIDLINALRLNPDKEKIQRTSELEGKLRRAYQYLQSEGYELSDIGVAEELK